MNCSFKSHDSPCSPGGVGSAILPLLACKRDMTTHLTSLGIGGKRGRGTEVSESELILNRAGMFGVDDRELETMTICPKHRKDFTIYWPGRKGQICCYPAHRGPKKQITLPRRVNNTMSGEIFAVFQVVVPIGAG